MASQSSSSSQGFPQVSSPITVPSTGILTQQWYNFFVNLWTRSGISQGGTLVPAGQIVAFAGPVSKIPEGWILCNGTSLSQTNFASLFQAIGTTWGGVGNLTFNVPDLQDKILIGAGPQHFLGTTGNLGNSGVGGAVLPQYTAVNYIIKT